MYVYICITYIFNHILLYYHIYIYIYIYIYDNQVVPIQHVFFKFTVNQNEKNVNYFYLKFRHVSFTKTFLYILLQLTNTLNHYISYKL